MRSGTRNEAYHSVIVVRNAAATADEFRGLSVFRCGRAGITQRLIHPARKKSCLWRERRRLEAYQNKGPQRTYE